MSHLPAATKVSVEDSKRRLLRQESKGQPTCSTSSSSSVLFSQLCLFCKKKSKWKNQTKEKLVQCVTKTAALPILESAKEKEDKELCEIRDQDLIAKEAQYHASCRKEYNRKLERNVLKRETIGVEEPP